MPGASFASGPHPARNNNTAPIASNMAFLTGPSSWLKKVTRQNTTPEGRCNGMGKQEWRESKRAASGRGNYQPIWRIRSKIRAL
jgi:hypothetical protein